MKVSLRNRSVNKCRRVDFCLLCVISIDIITKCSYYITQLICDGDVACQKTRDRVVVSCVHQTPEYTLVTSLVKEKCMGKHLVTGVHNFLPSGVIK